MVADTDTVNLVCCAVHGLQRERESTPNLISYCGFNCRVLFSTSGRTNASKFLTCGDVALALKVARIRIH